MKKTWSSILLVVATALVVLVGVDTGARRFVPPVNRREAEDGLKDLANSNPDMVVLGSSHARTLHVVGQELSRRTRGSRNLVAIPLENGKIKVYDWILRNRIAPLLEETASDGSLVRGRIKEFMLIIEWWDTCAPTKDGFAYSNLPSRAWRFEDFAADVAESGLNGYNRNYLQNRMRRLFAESGLVYDRLNQKLVENILDRLQGLSVEPSPEAVEQKVLNWRRMMEEGVSCIGSPSEIDALRDVLNYVNARGYETTILLFPRKPAVITERAKKTTLLKFANMVREIAGPDVRVIDLTTKTPLKDEDFMEDFDHVNAEGNRKFATWVLDHDLSFLQQPPDVRHVRLSQQGSVRR
ncbi:MAG: hypothetical protein ABW110_18335 [Steroidobacteraceae bacterium]